MFQRYNWKVSDNEMCKACQQYFMRMRNKFNVVQNMKVTKLIVFVWTNHPQLLCYFQTAFVAGFLSKYFCYVITILWKWELYCIILILDWKQYHTNSWYWWHKINSIISCQKWDRYINLYPSYLTCLLSILTNIYNLWNTYIHWVYSI